MASQREPFFLCYLSIYGASHRSRSSRCSPPFLGPYYVSQSAPPPPPVAAESGDLHIDIAPLLAILDGADADAQLQSGKPVLDFFTDTAFVAIVVSRAIGDCSASLQVSADAVVTATGACKGNALTRSKNEPEPPSFGLNIGWAVGFEIRRQEQASPPPPPWINRFAALIPSRASRYW